MSNTKTVVLALVAVVLVLGVCFFISANPWVSAGLAPVLLAIAAILRAVSGNAEDADEKTSNEKTNNEKTNKDTEAGVSRSGAKAQEDGVPHDEEAAEPDTITNGDEKDQDIEEMS